MEENKIRVKFSKTGCMKFVGHLDMLRFFQMAIRRAKIPVAYTNGFSPHISIAFAAPLAVGMESVGEYFDLDLAKDFESTNEPTRESTLAIKDCLNAQMVEGVRIEEITRLPQNAKNVMASLTAAAYWVDIHCDDESFSTLQEAFNSFKESDTQIIKKTKKGERTIRLRDYLYQAEMKDKGIHLILGAGSAAHISPKSYMEAFFASFEDSVKSEYTTYTIKRTEMFGDGETGLLPLGSL